LAGRAAVAVGLGLRGQPKRAAALGGAEREAFPPPPLHSKAAWRFASAAVQEISSCNLSQWAEGAFDTCGVEPITSAVMVMERSVWNRVEVAEQPQAIILYENSSTRALAARFWDAFKVRKTSAN